MNFSVSLEHFGNNKVLKCSKCQQMIPRKHILLKDNNITLHMMAYTYCLPLRCENSNACFPNFGTARTPYLIYDVYTNDSPHGVCFPKVITEICRSTGSV